MDICFHMVDTAFRYWRVLIYYLFLLESFKLKESSLHVIWKARAASLLCGAEWHNCWSMQGVAWWPDQTKWVTCWPLSNKRFRYCCTEKRIHNWKPCVNMTFCNKVMFQLIHEKQYDTERTVCNSAPQSKNAVSTNINHSRYIHLMSISCQSTSILKGCM